MKTTDRKAFAYAVVAILSFLIFAFILHLSAGCGPVTPPPPGPTPPLGYSCATYCQRATTLACTFAAPTTKGTTCEQVCLDVTAVIRWDLACRSNATTCEEIDNCERGR